MGIFFRSFTSFFFPRCDNLLMPKAMETCLPYKKFMPKNTFEHIQHQGNQNSLLFQNCTKNDLKSPIFIASSPCGQFYQWLIDLLRQRSTFCSSSESVVDCEELDFPLLRLADSIIFRSIERISLGGNITASDVLTQWGTMRVVKIILRCRCTI